MTGVFFGLKSGHLEEMRELGQVSFSLCSSRLKAAKDCTFVFSNKIYEVLFIWKLFIGKPAEEDLGRKALRCKASS